MKTGDLVKIDWLGTGRTYELCVVLSVHPHHNYYSGIDISLEVLSPDGRKYMYDVFRGQQLEVLALDESR